MNTPTITELINAEIESLQESLTRNPKHECRFCFWFDCGDKCKCGCGSVSKAKQLIIDRLRFLVGCAETGEVPVDVHREDAGSVTETTPSNKEQKSPDGVP